MSRSYCTVINNEIVRFDGEILVAGHVVDFQKWKNNELQIWVDMLNRAHDSGRKSAQKNFRAAIGLPN